MDNVGSLFHFQHGVQTMRHQLCSRIENHGYLGTRELSECILEGAKVVEPGVDDVASWLYAFEVRIAISKD